MDWEAGGVQQGQKSNYSDWYISISGVSCCCSGLYKFIRYMLEKIRVIDLTVRRYFNTTLLLSIPVNFDFDFDDVGL